MDTLILANAMLFLSTLSLRRATTSGQLPTPEPPHFYPRSPCGERRNGYPHTRQRDAISIHALLAESDSQQPDGTTNTTYFYPRSPCGERQPTSGILRFNPFISIHALLAESDGGSGVGNWPLVTFLSTLSLRRATKTSIAGRITSNDFYPRSPCGERLNGGGL